jgi:glycosyltransferase involved in cell wall biosynthesis
MMVLTRCSAQSTITSAIFGAANYQPASTGSEKQLVEHGPSRPSLSQLIRLRHEYDLVVIPGFQSIGLFTLLMCKLLGKTCVLKVDSVDSIEDTPESWAGDSALSGRGLRSWGWLLRYIDAFVTASHSVADKLVAQGIEPATIHTIPNSIDVEKFSKVMEEEKESLRTRLRIPIEATIITCAGHFDYPDNGLSLLFRVWCEILRRHENVYLVLVDSSLSEWPKDKAELSLHTRPYAPDNCLIFSGGELPVVDYLRASDIFVSSVENAAFKLTLLEAMACELPIVASRIGDSDKIIQQGQNGLIVEQGDFQQLFEAIDALIVSFSGAKRLGRRARLTIEQNYSAESVVAAYERLFCAILRS